MTLDSPILALCLLPVAILAIVLAGRRLEAAPRWLLRAAVLAMLGATAGLNLRCDRPPRIAVLIDVSPSTRGAAFHDAKSVAARLTPLLAGRPYTTHYFADGPVTSPDEPACDRTRLAVPPDTDAVVLLSDGRFAPPAELPPTYAVIDPALDAPADARVTDLRWADAASAGLLGRPFVANVVGSAETPLRLTNATPAAVTPPRGPGLVAAVATGGPVAARFDAGDLWPENDAMTLGADTSPARRIEAGVDAAGFDALPVTALPTNVDGYADVSSVVLSTAADVSAAQAAALTAYVHDFGGSLVLAGPPADAPPALRAVSPLSAVPPAGPGAWVVLLDASGSMAAGDGAGGTHWTAALASARAAIDRLPDDAAVTVLRFAGDVRSIAAGPAAAVRSILAGPVADGPSGPTGLRAALDALVRRGGPARVLLLSDGEADLGDAVGLATALRAAGLTLDAVSPSADVARLCAATGGHAVTDAAPTDWPRAMRALATARSPIVDRAEILTGRGPFASRGLASTRRWAAFAKAGAQSLADADDGPAAATWAVGVGRVTAVAAAVSAGDLAAIATAVERPPADPRFSVVFDDVAGVVWLRAADQAGPMNGLSAALRRDGAAATFRQSKPGEYVAGLPRRPTPAVAVVTVGGDVVARRSVPGRYAPEFDAVGNDRPALAAVARRSGGAVIEAGDNRPIAFVGRSVDWPLRPILGPAAAGLLVVVALSVTRGRTAKRTVLQRSPFSPPPLEGGGGGRGFERMDTARSSEPLP